MVMKCQKVFLYLLLFFILLSLCLTKLKQENIKLLSLHPACLHFSAVYTLLKFN